MRGGEVAGVSEQPLLPASRVQKGGEKVMREQPQVMIG